MVNLSAGVGESPCVDWPAFDMVAQAMGGLMGITGPDAKTTIKVGPSPGDVVPGAFAATVSSSSCCAPKSLRILKNTLDRAELFGM